MSRPIQVELLHHEGCPLAAAARRVVDECVHEMGVDAVVTERIARYPSPSVLVYSIDVMGSPPDDAPVDACRLDVPTHERVVAALCSAAL